MEAVTRWRILWKKDIGIVKESIASENLLLVHAQCLLELVQFCLELVFLQETPFMRKKWQLALVLKAPKKKE